MTINSSKDKRESVKNNYNLIAKDYGNDFGTYIEDLDVYEAFSKNLTKGDKILDLGAGSGRTYAYFSQKGFDYIALDFSEKMKEEAYKIHGKFPYILDDIVNIKQHFENNSIDAVFSVYTLFHLPKEDFKKVITDIYDILKVNGIFLFSYQIGQGEEMVDEPYLKETGHNCLYMNYQKNEEIDELLSNFAYKKIYRKEKIETSEVAINSNSATTVFLLIKKIK